MHLPHTKFALLTCLLILFSGISCKKSATDNIYTGTVFYTGCLSVGIDIDGPTGYGKGISWKGHTNAVAIGNKCLLDNLNIAVGNTITFKISDTNTEPGNNCYFPTCAVADDLPRNSIYIYNVTKTN